MDKKRKNGMRFKSLAVAASILLTMNQGMIAYADSESDINAAYSSADDELGSDVDNSSAGSAGSEDVSEDATSEDSETVSAEADGSSESSESAVVESHETLEPDSETAETAECQSVDFDITELSSGTEDIDDALLVSGGCRKAVERREAHYCLRTYV